MHPEVVAQFKLGSSKVMEEECSLQKQEELHQTDLKQGPGCFLQCSVWFSNFTHSQCCFIGRQLERSEGQQSAATEVEGAEDGDAFPSVPPASEAPQREGWRRIPFPGPFENSNGSRTNRRSVSEHALALFV